MDRRSLLQGAVSLLGATAFRPSIALSATAPQADAERLKSGEMQLRWSGLKGPAKIFASSDPSAQPASMTLLSKAALGPTFETAQPKNPRPYFLLTGSTGSVRTAERLLPLDGGRNFRDLGGYRSTDGKQVRWGRLYRSGVMAELTEGDITYLSKLGVRTICDLRTEGERTKEPAPFKGPDAPQIISFSYDMSGGAMKTLHASKTREEAVEAFSDAYVEMTSFLAPNLTDVFSHLKAQETPMAVNCSAGKDRTGITSALILSVLDVPRDTIIADYALTEKYQPASFFMGRVRTAPNPVGKPSDYEKMPSDVMKILMGSDPEVMRRALAKIDAKLGGPVALVKARYGVTDTDITSMRSAYLYQS